MFELRHYTLFPDRRDEGLLGPVRDALRGGPTHTVGPYGGPDGWSFSTAARIEADEVVRILQGFDWQHQPLLLHRTDSEDRWNWLHVIRKQENLWADDERG